MEGEQFYTNIKLNKNPPLLKNSRGTLKNLKN